MHLSKSFLSIFTQISPCIRPAPFKLRLHCSTSPLHLPRNPVYASLPLGLRFPLRSCSVTSPSHLPGNPVYASLPLGLRFPLRSCSVTSPSHLPGNPVYASLPLGLCFPLRSCFVYPPMPLPAARSSILRLCSTVSSVYFRPSFTLRSTSPFMLRLRSIFIRVNLSKVCPKALQPLGICFNAFLYIIQCHNKWFWNHFTFFSSSFNCAI